MEFKNSTGTGVWPDQALSSPATRVIAVFTDDQDSAIRALRHVRGGAAGTPVWLYSTVQPAPEIAALADRVVVQNRPIYLLTAAQRELWPFRSALGVSAWTGRGSRLLRLSLPGAPLPRPVPQQFR